jgi:thiol-disulfide isomerase/thioredoxin
MKRSCLALLLVSGLCSAAIIADVRAAIAKGDLAAGEALIEQYRKQRGVTPEMIEAHSWLGRGALAARRYDKADSYAAQTRDMVLVELRKRLLDAEKHLPIALGASIEVQGQVMAVRGERSASVDFLQRELARWRSTSIRTRIQKNINLLSLEGKPAPPLELNEHLGLKPAPFAELKGKAVLLFFWAHWCPDCKSQSPVLSRLAQEFGPKGLVILSPTQRYGYAARGQEVTPQEELTYINQVRQQYYPDMAVPVSEENFKNYGSSTTPTLVLIDRQGIIRLYHPGRMSYEELAPLVARIAG